MIQQPIYQSQLIKILNIANNRLPKYKIMQKTLKYSIIKIVTSKKTMNIQNCGRSNILKSIFSSSLVTYFMMKINAFYRIKSAQLQEQQLVLVKKKRGILEINERLKEMQQQSETYFSSIKLGLILLKRYYLALIGISYRVWTQFFLRNKTIFLALGFLLFF